MMYITGFVARIKSDSWLQTYLYDVGTDTIICVVIVSRRLFKGSITHGKFTRAT